LINIFLNPLLLVKVLTLMAVVSFVLTAYYISAEKDMDFVYGVIFTFYAFFFLKWTKPYALLTLRDGRWMTR
jgi:hyaluronan synthase